MNLRQPKNGSEDGFSIVSAVVGLAVASIVLMAIVSLNNHVAKGAKFIDRRDELNEIRNTIITRLDCAATLAGMASTCNGGTVAIKGSHIANASQILIAIPVTNSSGTVYQKFGSYSLQAVCATGVARVSHNHALVIKYAAYDPAGNFMKDPLTGKVLNWTNGSDLFGGIPIACEVPF